MIYWPKLAEIAGNLGDDVHLWLGSTAALPPEIKPDFCSAAEQVRASKFASRDDAARYLQIRSLLRQLLAAYVREPPEVVAIAEGKDGKPYLSEKALSFNLSHSGSSVAIAVRAGADERQSLGVDVQIAKTVDELAVARALFSESEIAMLAGLSGAARHHQFFRLWSCREAVLKAKGLGMKGRGFQLKQDANGAYQVWADAPVWKDIALYEFQPRGDIFGALAWSQTSHRPQIRQFKIGLI